MKRGKKSSGGGAELYLQRPKGRRVVTGNWGKVSGVYLDPDMSACWVIYQNVQRRRLAGPFVLFSFICCGFFFFFFFFLAKERKKVKSLSHVRLFATPWTVAHRAPLSMGFSRQEYWSGLPFLLQGIFPSQGPNPGLPHCGQTLYPLSHQGRVGVFFFFLTKRGLEARETNHGLLHTECCGTGERAVLR